MQTRLGKRLWILLCVSLLGSMTARANGPFEPVVSLETTSGVSVVQVQIRVPPGHMLYADALQVEVDRARLTPLDVPRPSRIHDPLLDEEKDVYQADFLARYRLDGLPTGGTTLTLSWMGCDDALCYPPESREYRLGKEGVVALEPAEEPEESDRGAWRQAAEQFDVVARGSGFMGREAFLAFLDEGGRGEAEPIEEAKPQAERGMFAALLLILLGGLALNLTPCVLPLIPINLAIIGAGARAGSPRRGFLLGGLYGAGMAVAYGLLGIVVVVTGSTFGALNASSSFNIAIAIVFLVLGVALFDVIQIDLSRFRGPGKSGAQAATGPARWVGVFFMGAMAALLAGACVAPVVISVLVWAGTLYGDGAVYGLFLPLLLGIGMALPWPFAGAGLSFLPKPGRWMVVVKHAFGVLVLGMAAYYGWEGYRLLRGGNTSAGEFAAALNTAAAAGKPVLLDVGASWCKNCRVMESTTFEDPGVQERLRDFSVIHYRAEQPEAEPARAILKAFDVRGLPTYLVLRPRAPEAERGGGN